MDLMLMMFCFAEAGEAFLILFNAGQAARAVAEFLINHSVLAVIVLLLIALILICLLVVTSDRHKKKRADQKADKTL